MNVYKDEEWYCCVQVFKYNIILWNRVCSNLLLTKELFNNIPLSTKIKCFTAVNYRPYLNFTTLSINGLFLFQDPTQSTTLHLTVMAP